MTGLKKLLPLAIVAVALFHFAALGSRVWSLEKVVSNGDRHLFMSAPVDPVDYFSGRYVAIRLDAATIKLTPEQRKNFDYQSKYWVGIERGEDGFSRFSGVVDENHPGPKVRARVWLSGEDEARVDPPFSRFYMNEKLAPMAETAYTRAANRTQRKAWVAVRVGDGVGVIEELYIEGKPVAEYLADESREVKR